MVTKLGTLSHAKVFVVNKLRKQEQLGGSHVPVSRIPTKVAPSD
jgi:hypothetical protein